MRIFLISKKGFGFGFKNRSIEKNYYEILEIPYDSDLNQVRKAYIKLAKKYHPDLTKDPNGEEKFKEIKKAYEVLGDPNNRIEYDIINNYSNDQSKYEKKTGNNIRFNPGPRTIKNFYYNKWTDYKTPSWVNLKSGKDIKSEYIYRKDDEEDVFFSQSNKESKIVKIMKKYRIFLYIIFIFSFDIFLIFENYGFYQIYTMYRDVFIKTKNI
jgi:curved DNA-binding protein CbpA